MEPEDACTLNEGGTWPEGSRGWGSRELHEVRQHVAMLCGVQPVNIKLNELEVLKFNALHLRGRRGRSWGSSNTRPDSFDWGHVTIEVAISGCSY